MIDYSPQVKAADKLADVVDRVLREKVLMTELVTALLEYRCAQAVVDEDLGEMLDSMEKESRPVLDYEKKKLYTDEQMLKEVSKDKAKNSKSERS